MSKIILYNDEFVPWQGWKIYQTNKKIEKFDLDNSGEFWQKCRTKEVCALYNSGGEKQVPFNLTVLVQLMREKLIPLDWIKYLRDSLPAAKEASYTNLNLPFDHPVNLYNEDIIASKVIPIRNFDSRITEDSRECIAFVGTVYLNHNGEQCVPALYMKANEQLDIRYICPKEMLKTNSSALAHVHGFRDVENNLPSVIAYGMINLRD